MLFTSKALHGLGFALLLATSPSCGFFCVEEDKFLQEELRRWMPYQGNVMYVFQNSAGLKDTLMFEYYDAGIEYFNQGGCAWSNEYIEARLYSKRYPNLVFNFLITETNRFQAQVGILFFEYTYFSKNFLREQNGSANYINLLDYMGNVYPEALQMRASEAAYLLPGQAVSYLYAIDVGLISYTTTDSLEWVLE